MANPIDTLFGPSVPSKVTEAINAKINDSSQADLKDSGRHPLRDKDSAFTMSRISWDEGGSKGTPKGTKLVFRVNPNEVSFSMKIRSVHQDVKHGKVYYYWRNTTNKKRGVTHFYEPEVSFNFQSGNIRPIVNVGDAVYLPENLDNFFLFLKLMDEDPLYGNQPNFVRIRYHSNIFPNILLEGFFEPETSWVDSAENPSSVNSWSARFIVHSSIPALSKGGYEALKTMFTNELNGSK